ncbi:hypothetical protein I5677_07010 [Mobilitalea sibirica]|uniref:Uncharacterized protein n=1 Tax=Mobilitalea sibirica TaxID=1462919 RepID=A0A8J7H1Z1_9FIRM|nr:hypothetical protein [Mobilitalea sibirica]MBH1940634.1 hypothetical protein [Mobilitalea sibirica]
MNIQLLLVMIISLSMVLPIVWFLVQSIDRKDKRKVNIGAVIFMKSSKGSPWYRLYSMIHKFPLTGRYLDRIDQRYEVLYPGDPRAIAIRTMKAVCITWTVCIAEIILLYFLKPSLHNSIIAVYLSYVIHNEIINLIVGNTEIRLLEQMTMFISDVSHNYHINRLVDDAILSSIDGLGHEMKVHANYLYKIVTSNNLREDVIQYNTTTHNRYLKMFLSLCISVIEYNDKKVNGQLLFTANLRHLLREINIEILKLKKLKYVFTGTVFVTVAVCLPIDAIQRFGISLVPELKDFYHGRGGIIFIGVIILSSMTVYLLVNHLKNIRYPIPKMYRYLKKLEQLQIIRKALTNYTDKNYGKMLLLRDTLKRVGDTISPRQLLLKRMVIFVMTFVLALGMVFYMHHRNRQNITEAVNNIEMFASSTYHNQTDQISDTILLYVNIYKNENVTESYIKDELIKEKPHYNTLYHEKIAKEIVDRIERYQRENLQWYEFAVCIGLSVIAYYIPFWMVLYKKKILRIAMEDEVNQFNSIIYMMMYIEHLTVKDLLEQMELFAFVFKSSLQECINDYNSGDIEALIRMREKESYGPFRRLVDNLIRCDTIAIDKAFSEIASDRENLHDKRKQENEISVQKRADIAKPLSFVPAVLVTIYLLMPLLIASLNELQGFKESLSTVGF